VRLGNGKGSEGKGDVPVVSKRSSPRTLLKHKHYLELVSKSSHRGQQEELETYKSNTAKPEVLRLEQLHQRKALRLLQLKVHSSADLIILMLDIRGIAAADPGERSGGFFVAPGFDEPARGFRAGEDADTDDPSRDELQGDGNLPLFGFGGDVEGDAVVDWDWSVLCLVEIYCHRAKACAGSSRYSRRPSSRTYDEVQ